MLLSGILVWRTRVAAAWTLAVLAWIALGAVAIGVERTSVRANHVSRLISAGQIDLSKPLR
jgi:hypothetical protein